MVSSQPSYEILAFDRMFLNRNNVPHTCSHSVSKTIGLLFNSDETASAQCKRQEKRIKIFFSLWEKKDDAKVDRMTA
jgi:hypothetical protein